MNMFDPALYTDVARSLLEARTLPRWCYVSEELYEREIERIFMRTWNSVDSVETIPNPSDYIAVERCPTLDTRCDDNRMSRRR
jgi:hypothetical protein